MPAGRDYMDELGARPRLSGLWTVFLATRLPFLTATLIPVGLGGVVAARDGAFHAQWFVLALVAAMAVHLGLNMANDLFDDANGADAANVTPTPFSGGSRVLQYGLVSRRAMVTGCVALYALSIGVGVFLAAERGWGLLAIGAVGVALSLAYSAPPLRLVHRGLGEPVTALGFGPVMAVGTYFACTGRWSWQPVLASLPVALPIALVLYVNQVPDRTGDAAVGKRTLIVRFTPPRCRWRTWRRRPPRTRASSPRWPPGSRRCGHCSRSARSRWRGACGTACGPTTETPMASCPPCSPTSSCTC